MILWIESPKSPRFCGERRGRAAAKSPVLKFPFHDGIGRLVCRDMSTQKAPSLPLYAFLASDVVFVVAAWWIATRSPQPLDLAHVFAVLASLACGAVCGILPFMRQYQAQLEMNETDKLASTVAQIRELAKIGRVVREAADQWHHAQEASSETVKAARGVFDKMAEETRSFHEFLENAHKTEINNLRLQVEKLRKTDQEWMQITVNILDHVFALYDAGQKSEHAGVARQLAQFRAACYDIVRRNGLIPFEAEPGEPYDSRKCQLKDTNFQPQPHATVDRTLATGYTFQGQLLRKALVEIDHKPAGEEISSIASVQDSGSASYEEGAGTSSEEAVTENSDQASASPARVESGSDTSSEVEDPMTRFDSEAELEDREVPPVEGATEPEVSEVFEDVESRANEGDASLDETPEEPKTKRIPHRDSSSEQELF